MTARRRPQTAAARTGRKVTDRSWMIKHRRQVARLKAALVEGSPCWWCGAPMYRSQDLDGDHSLARAHGGTETDRLLHSSCNRQRGDGSFDHARPALTGKPFTRGKYDRSEWLLLPGW